MGVGERVIYSLFFSFICNIIMFLLVLETDKIKSRILDEWTESINKYYEKEKKHIQEIGELSEEKIRLEIQVANLLMIIGSKGSDKE